MGAVRLVRGRRVCVWVCSARAGDGGKVCEVGEFHHTKATNG